MQTKQCQMNDLYHHTWRDHEVFAYLKSSQLFSQNIPFIDKNRKKIMKRAKYILLDI